MLFKVSMYYYEKSLLLIDNPMAMLGNGVFHATE